MSGKWFGLKKLVFMILLGLRKHKQSKAASSKSGAAGYGVKSRSSIDEMDCVQPLCDDEMVATVFAFVPETKFAFPVKNTAFD